MCRAGLVTSAGDPHLLLPSGSDLQALGKVMVKLSKKSLEGKASSVLTGESWLYLFPDAEQYCKAKAYLNLQAFP